MRKTSARTPCFISRGIPHSSNREHWRRCPRLHWFLLFLLAALAVSVGGQDLKPLPASALADRAQRALREQWFLRGRSSPGQSGAAQRYRAYLQKMRMRSARPAMAQKLGRDASPAALVWSSLGPARLPSDASGVGEYNYGWVSGRATSVAIDPADPTGNTVYIGGAYGGVWKSTNAGPASQSPANVVWQPLTDNQATLAIGAIAIQPGNTNPNNSGIVVGTGEANSSADSYYGLGLLQSADAGTTWTLISSDTTGTR